MLNRLRLYSIAFSVVYWTLAGFYFVAIRYVGLGEFAPPDLNYTELALYAGIVGPCIGLLFGVFPLSNLIGLNKRRSFSTVVLIGTCSYVLFFTAVIFIASTIGNSIPFAIRYVFSPDGLMVLFHLSMSSLLYNFLVQVNKKFGPGVLLEYALGKYFAPKVEERAFMFLDLKSSTRLAETLEHVAYTRLVQDCYAELTRPLVEYDAQVYQYVGDEVVVSWKMDGQFSASSCIQFFSAFQQRLQSRRNYFIALYGVQPEFKAGAHCGRVTVAEVGEIKTEIAYHGDVLNTASRIQSLCNRFEKQLLISEALAERLAAKDREKLKFTSDEELRGKGTPTKIYSIES